MGLNENKPIYLQLADQIMDEVENSGYRNGHRLPSVRDHAANVGVNANTVMRTYAWLQQEGIIYNQRGIGYFFAQDAKERIMEMRRREMLDGDIYDFMDRLIALGISPDDFKEMYNAYLASRQSKSAISIPVAEESK